MTKPSPPAVSSDDAARKLQIGNNDAGVPAAANVATPVKVEIGDKDADALRLAEVAAKLVAAGRPTTLDIALRPGRYRTDLLVEDDSVPTDKRGRIDVHLHSLDPAHPAIIVGGNVDLYGANVTIEDVVFEGANGGAAPLQIGIRHQFVMRRCVITGNVLGGRGGGRLILVGAEYGGTPMASFEDTWFANNRGGDRSALVSLDPRLGSVRFVRSVFVDNELGATVLAGGTSKLRFERCVLARGAHDRDLGFEPHFVSRNDPATTLSFDHGVVVLAHWDELVHAPGSAPATIASSTVYAAGAAPAGVTVTGGHVEAIARAHALLVHLARLAAHAAAHRPPTGDALLTALGVGK